MHSGDRERGKKLKTEHRGVFFVQSVRDTVCLPFFFPAGCETRGESTSSQRDAGSADCRHQCRRRGFLIIRGCKEEEAAAELTLAKAC